MKGRTGPQGRKYGTEVEENRLGRDRTLRGRHQFPRPWEFTAGSRRREPHDGSSSVDNLSRHWAVHPTVGTPGRRSWWEKEKLDL